ncbi:hypothetical protein [Paraburkholderia terricola]|uniref:Uncharacterized protein n=1 Tax=Paraburkholderia terricola TaxID=169427 RepID=A0ABU1LQ65_9BURK|nr:hypothetical protein [Paraburkholderia terricola]MDR6408891.1 hypothetical protein [Paraburkholderia terricola]MDR6482208.1 hypothetical protein [Paraburkholderia terricola]
MDSLSSANRFVSGFFFGTLVAAVIMVLLCNARELFPFVAKLHALEQIVLTALLSIVIVDAKPLAYQTVWRERRSAFVLDEDLSATLSGRTFGIPAGILVGILFQHYVMN